MSRAAIGALALALIVALVAHDVLMANDAAGTRAASPRAVVSHASAMSFPSHGGPAHRDPSEPLGEACGTLRTWSLQVAIDATGADAMGGTIVAPPAITEPALRGIPPGQSARVRRALLQVYRN
jgi:hypothetical protein